MCSGNPVSYYDPETGRFISADSAEFSSFSADDIRETNLFSYGNNNPVMKMDPYGNLSNGWKLAITGTILVTSVAVIIATGVSIETTSEEFGCW